MSIRAAAPAAPAGPAGPPTVSSPPTATPTTPDKEARVLGELTDRYRAIERARLEACASDNVVNVINAVRDQRNERILEAADVPRIRTLEKCLVQIAREPFAPLPSGYATHVGSVHRDAIDKAPRGGSRDAFQLYERAVEFASYSELLKRLEEAAAAYPDRAPRLSPTMEAVRARVNRSGPAFLYYSGCTVAGSAATRAEDDMKIDGGRLVTNLLKHWNVSEVEVYKLNLPDVKITPYEYRSQRRLQLEEHSVISVRYPHNLNSAPGGFRHEYRVDRYDPRPWPEFQRDASADAQLRTDVKTHLTGFFSWFANQPNGRRISPHSLAAQIDAASPTFTLRGRSPMVAIGKDVTHEEFDGEHGELGYRERLAGPGPWATNMALLHQHGVDGLVSSTEDRRRLLPPFTDLYLAPRHWWEIALIFLLRFLAVHRWPVVIWVESAEVCWAFSQEALGKVKLDDRGRFLDNAVHDPSGSCDVEKQNVVMSQWVGHAFITSLGDGRHAVVLANYDRGCIKYDAELAQDRWELQLAADAAHQARVGAYIAHIDTHGYPSDRAAISRMWDLGEEAIPGDIVADLERLRKRVAERENIIKSLRSRGASARGVQLGMDSTQAKGVRNAAYLRHEKVEGERRDRRKTIPDDRIRVAQFQRLLAQQEDLEARRLPNPRHPCRPAGMSVDQWRDWFMQLGKGVEIMNSAAQHGKVPIDRATQLKGLEALQA